MSDPESSIGATLLQLRGLKFTHASARSACLAGVDLELRAGELVALIGPNGAGKSTLLRLAAGLLQPSSGEVRCRAGVVRDLSSRRRAKELALVPQGLVRWPGSRVEEFVAGGRYAHRGMLAAPGEADRVAITEALAAAGLVGEASRSLAELSGGQRQRALIARALAQETPLLLVDEPTNSLDPSHQLSIFEWLGRMTCEGRGVLVVTHDLNLASQFATRLALLTEGRIVASGTPAEVLRPEVLAPVYGSRLRYGRLPSPLEPGERPYVLPWSV